MNDISIYFDGACTPTNPGGIGSWGYIIQKDGKNIVEDCGVAEDGKPSTCNVAEYFGLISALKKLNELDEAKFPIKIYGDSNLVIQMVTKKWGWRKGAWLPHRKMPHLKVLLFEALELLEGKSFTAEWISRDYNEEADRLSKLGYKKFIEVK